MRNPYKMRAVVGFCHIRWRWPNDKNFLDLPQDSQDRLTARDVLECGHLRHPPQIDSVVDAMSAAFRELEPDAVHKRRCYECAKVTEVAA